MCWWVEKLSFTGALLLGIALLSAQSPIRNFPPGVFQNRGAIDGGSAPTCDATHGPPSGFLPNTGGGNYSGNAGDVTAVVNLMCGLVTDGLFSNASSGYCGTQFDLFYFFSVTVNTDAHLNLCTGTTFTISEVGSPTFTTKVGFNGAQGAGGKYLATGFNLLSGGNYAQNNAHISLWSNTNETSAFSPFGIQDATTISYIFPRNTSNQALFVINEPIPGFSSGVSQGAVTKGHFMSVRTGASAQAGYFNASNAGVTPVTSAPPTNGNVDILTANVSGTPTSGSDYILCSFTIGTAMSPAQVTLLYNRLNTATAAQSCI